MRNYGIHSSGCMTLDIPGGANGVMFKNLKHKGMRQGCHCIEGRDIGAYDTCLNGCKYCYANTRPEKARENYKRHAPPHLCCWGIYRKRIQYSREHRNNETISGRLLSYFSEGSLVLYTYPLQVTTPLLQQAKWTNDNMDAIPVLW